MRYYIDTCVWIDFVEDRTNNDFLAKCIENEDIILYSYPLEKELLNYMSKIKIIYSLLLSKELIEYVDVTNEDKSEAFNLSKDRTIPFSDALHAVLSRNNDAILVSRDKHFLKLKDICRMKLL